MNDETLIVLGIALVMFFIACIWDWHEVKRQRWNDDDEHGGGL